MGSGGREGKRPGEGARPAPAAEADVQRLLHELEVHQVELELQNEELRRSRLEVETGLLRYAELFDVAPVGYFVLDPGGVVRDLNHAAASLLGAEPGRLPGGPLSAVVHPGDQDAFRAFLARLLASPAGGDACGDRGCEVRLVRPPGGGPPVRARLCGVRLAGRPEAVLVAAEDVTEWRAAEDALRAESRRKDEFLAALSHELRNPLAPIRSGLGVLARAPPGSDPAVRALRVLQRQVAHLARIVDDLLDVTRIARGKVRLHREPAELGELVQRCVEDHRPTFQEASIAVEASLPREPCWVLVDTTRVAQIVGNLLGNAAKFTAPGGRVEVAVTRDGDAAALAVRDTGVGIAPEVQARLFEPFSQAPQTLARTRGGLGLGLATVKGLVELHGGSVTLSSAGPGRGAEFTVRLPLTAPPAAEPPAARPGDGHRRRVLVVDDNEDAASTLQEILSLSGHEVHVAHDGPRGVALASALRPEIVICDIGLPGMDGYAVARALRADPGTRDAYLVALSGYALPDDLRRAAEAGFDRHLAKPLPVDALERALAERPRARAAGAAGAAHSPGAGP